MTTVLLSRENFGELWLPDFVKKSKAIEKIVWKGEDFPAGVKHIIRWGTTSNVPKVKTYNPAKFIHVVADKTGFRRLMQQGAKKICPTTYFSHEDFMEKGGQFPLIIRPQKHAWGEGLLVANNFKEFKEAADKCGEGWYASEFIDKRREYRIFIVQGRVAFVAERPPKRGRIYWGGGGFNNIRWGQWPIEAVRVALEGYALSRLHFCAADVLEDADGKCYITELNTAPQISCEYKQECVAMCFDQMVKEEGKPIAVEHSDNWKNYIHPALSEKAIVGEENGPI